MVPRLGCFVVLLPLIELFGLIQVGQAQGFWPLLGWVLASAVLGLGIIRTQGLQTMARYQSALLSGTSPGRALVDGASIWVGGMLLLVPGFLTDALALALFFPPSRRLFQGWLMARMARGVRQGAVRVSMMGMDVRTGRPFDPDAPTGHEQRDPAPRPGEIIQPPPPRDLER